MADEKVKYAMKMNPTIDFNNFPPKYSEISMISQLGNLRKSRYIR